MLACLLGLIDGDVSAYIRAVADDNQDGPVHVVHLAAACEHTAQTMSGSLLDPPNPGVAFGAQLMASSVSGSLVPGLVEKLHSEGFNGAVDAARAIGAEARYLVLDSLVGYWSTSITALQMDISSVLRDWHRPT